jgi:hypothetical protein
VDLIHCVAVRTDFASALGDGLVGGEPSELLLFEVMQLCPATLLDRVNMALEVKKGSDGAWRALAPLEERELYYIAHALAKCVAFVQDGGGQHLDIKPTNVFFDSEGNILLGDFGLSRMDSHGVPSWATLDLLSRATFMPREMCAPGWGGGGGGGGAAGRRRGAWVRAAAAGVPAGGVEEHQPGEERGGARGADTGAEPGRAVPTHSPRRAACSSCLPYRTLSPLVVNTHTHTPPRLAAQELSQFLDHDAQQAKHRVKMRPSTGQRPGPGPGPGPGAGRHSGAGPEDGGGGQRPRTYYY